MKSPLFILPLLFPSLLSCSHIGETEWNLRLDPDQDGILLDEDCAPNDADETLSTMVAFFPDADQDGYGASPPEQDTGLGDYVLWACAETTVEGWAPNSDDCDDNNSEVNPGAEEIEWYDDVDQNCEGNTHDQDNDGYVRDEDCDDTDPELTRDTCRMDNLTLNTFNACGIWGDQKIECWGAEDAENADFTKNRSITASHMISNNTTTCALQQDGTLSCWGNGATELQTLIPQDMRFKAVDISETAMCGISDTDELNCWGSLDSTPLSTTPMNSVNVGTYCACGLDENSHAQCWGEPGTCEGVQTQAFKKVAVGHYNACALTESGVIQCWGGQSELLDNIPSGGQYQDLDVYGVGGCALTSAGIAKCWGEPALNENLPTSIAFSSIAVGELYACGINQDDGFATCWGAQCRSANAEACKAPEWAE